MGKEVTFMVEGKPFGKQRPRVVRRGRFTTTYTPKETIEYENKVRKSYLSVKGDNRLSGAIETTIIGTFEVPKSATKKQQLAIENNEELYTKKPDCDNIGKSVLDALNHVAYDDDSKIVALHIYKRYGDTAKVDVDLREVSKDIISPVTFVDNKVISPISFIGFNKSI